MQVEERSQSTVEQEEPAHVLIVDDEPEVRRTLARLLANQGLRTCTAASGTEALELLHKTSVGVALVDLQMPQMNGFELLDEMKRRKFEAQVMIMTAHGNVDVAVQAIHAGAYHFFMKPFRSLDEIVLTTHRALEFYHLKKHSSLLEMRLLKIEQFGELIGNSQVMKLVYQRALSLAASSSAVLISGESGTGKELTARAIHAHSPRARRRFVTVNCSAIPENLIESELFGHVRGAFTGAISARAGLFESAEGGTLFLDEVGDLPPFAQVKLLRALQEGEVRRVGSDETRHVDVRVIAATNVDLRAKVLEGSFRQDLFYRLGVVELQLPPLRERREDIPLLVSHFLQKHAPHPSLIKRVSPEALLRLRERFWPGNIRELENAMIHATVFCSGPLISEQDLPPSNEEHGRELRRTPLLPRELAALPYKLAKERILAEFDASYLSFLLEETQGNVAQAARRAGLDRSNFRRALRRAGLRPSDFLLEEGSPASSGPVSHVVKRVAPSLPEAQLEESPARERSS